jgi:hypothetical protein
MTKERPILFSGPMVQAILEGGKTQSRRVVKLPTNQHGGFDLTRCGEAKWACSENGPLDVGFMFLDCPYGQVGDRLWVRETWAASQPGWAMYSQFLYKADHAQTPSGPSGPLKWKPSIFMPRSACRLELEITGVRVERLQDITEEDAKAEGASSRTIFDDTIGWQMDWGDVGKFSRYCPSGILTNSDVCLSSAKYAFWNYWDRINQKRGFGWETKPWVWVIEFKRVGND